MRKNDPPKYTEEEVDNAELALEEYEKFGYTTRVCLRCQTGFTFDVGRNYYRITCGTPGCFDYTVRGI